MFLKQSFYVVFSCLKSAALTVIGVSDSSVLFVKEQKRIILFYVSEKIEPDDLKDALTKKLTDHMIPSVCIRVENIPYTHAGKSDKKTLRRIYDEYEASRPEATRKYEVEEKFHGYLQKVS